MKYYKYLKPYIRRVNGKEIYDGDVCIAYKLAVYQKYKIGYVLVLHGFPNEAILIGKSKIEVEKKFDKIVKSMGIKFKDMLKQAQFASQIINIEVNHENRPV